MILRALLHGVTRFADLRQVVPGLSDRMLSERLRELPAEGIVVRHVHAETPVRIEYSLRPQPSLELDSASTAVRRTGRSYTG